MGKAANTADERTALWKRKKTSQGAIAAWAAFSALLVVLAIIWMLYLASAWIGHASLREFFSHVPDPRAPVLRAEDPKNDQASLREVFSNGPPPASLVAERTHCINTPFDVCDSRVTVSSLGPEQGCHGSVGDEASGKFFVSSFHTGTSNEMAWLSDKLGLKTNIGGFCAHTEASRGNENNPYVFSNDRVKAIWGDKQLASRLESYAGVISTDTSLAMFPFLQNPAFENKPLIIWITNRYDTTMSDHMPSESFDNFLKVVEHASCCRKNVFFVAAHPAEIEYAKVKYPHVDVRQWRTIYPIGHQSKWFTREMSNEHRSGPSLNAEPFKSDTLCIYPNDNERDIIQDYEAALIKASIHFDNALSEVGHRSYGGARGLSIRCKGILHVPYAPQTMALWENVQTGNIFFLPSAKLVAQWRAADKIKVFQMSRGVGGLDRELTEDFLNRTEWYRQDRQPLFIYFDSPEDLAHKFKTLDFEQKRKQIRAYMDKHEVEQLSKWREIFAEANQRNTSDRVLRPRDSK